MSPPPTRVGFIGISANACSVANAEAAIKEFGLGDDCKAYGDVEDLAKDSDIDLVVCSINVLNHSTAITPSLLAGKSVYVEWPLGKNLQDAQTLLDLKNQYKVQTAMVGLQARQAPIISKTKELIASGRIGKVLNSTWNGYGLQGGKSIGEGMAYFTEKRVGGNFWTIHVAHALDYVQCVLGYNFTSPPQTLLKTQQPIIQILGKNGEVIKKDAPMETPDTIFLQGVLSPSIPLSIQFRVGAPFPGTPGLDWRIKGEEGEIRITGSGPFIQIGYPDLKLQVESNGEVETFEIGQFGEEEGIDGIPYGNVSRVYRELRDGRVNCTFEEAVELHKVLEEAWKANGYEV